MHVLIENDLTKLRKAINGVVYVGLSTLKSGYTVMNCIMDDGGHFDLQLHHKCTIYVNQSNEPTGEKPK